MAVRSAADLAAAVSRDHTCARFKEDHRSGENFEGSDVDAWDVDNDGTDDPKLWVTPEKFAAEFEDVNYALVPSRHNGMEKNGESARPRFHVFFPHKRIADKDTCDTLKKSVQKAYAFFDENCLDPARFLYGSSVKSEDIIWHEGKMDIDVFMKRQEELTPGGYRIPQGRRNSTMSRFAGRVVKRYGHGEDARSVFMNEASRCDPPLSDEELGRIWASAGKFSKRISSDPGYVAPEVYNALVPQGPAGSLKPQDYSDIGEAKVLSAEYSNELRYSPATDFLHYDGVVWEESEPEAVGAVEQFLDLQLADAELLCFNTKNALINSGLTPDEIGGKKPPGNLGDDLLRLFYEYREALMYQSFVMKRRDIRPLKAAMEAAKPMLYVKHSDLDKDEFLLNTPGATYDLRLGLMGRLDHSHTDLITKVTSVDPGEQGRELWEDSLQKTFCGDQEVIDYVQEVIGLAAIGKVYVEALIIAYGEGRNGKSTFFNTVSKVLGSYSGSLSADALVVSTRRNVKWEITELKGKRLVIAAELEEGQRLSTSMLKQITSTDDIQGEKKFRDPLPFTPSHTTILFTNHLPKVGANDAGTWRRLIVIPFYAVFEDSNDKKNFADFLYKEAGPAVLSWIIEGAERVIEKHYHLKRPKVVQDAIEEYRQDNDWFAAFLEDCCDVDPSYKVKAGELYQEYRSFCDRVGEFTRSAAEFSNTLINAGFRKKKTKNGAVYSGLRIKSVFSE